MLATYLIGLLLLMGTEYGFQSRSRAIAAWSGGWRWGRTAVRLVAMGLVWFMLRWGGVVGAWTYAVVGAILLELGARLQRRWIQADLDRGRKHGGALSHLFVLLYPIAYAAVMMVLVRRVHVEPLDGLDPALIGILLVAAVLVSLWTWATLMVVTIVAVVRPEQVPGAIAPSVGAGEVIGILERYVTFVLVLSGGLAAVGFVVAAKAAARFPQFEREEFAEYFLIGTLSSVGVSVLLGLSVRWFFISAGIL